MTTRSESSPPAARPDRKAAPLCPPEPAVTGALDCRAMRARKDLIPYVTTSSSASRVVLAGLRYWALPVQGAAAPLAASVAAARTVPRPNYCQEAVALHKRFANTMEGNNAPVPVE